MIIFTTSLWFLQVHHNLPDNLFTNDVHNLATCYFTVCFVLISEGMRRNHVKVSSDHNIELVMAQWF